MNVYVFERNGDWSNDTLFVAAKNEQEAKDLAVEKAEISANDIDDYEIQLHPKLKYDSEIPEIIDSFYEGE